PHPASSTLCPYTTLFRSRRQFPQGGGVDVAEYGHRHRARDRGGGHDEVVRRLFRLCAQDVSLLHAEAVLFIDDDEAEFSELHVLDRKSTRLNSSHVSISY